MSEQVAVRAVVGGGLYCLSLSCSSLCCVPAFFCDRFQAFVGFAVLHDLVVHT